jgi:hypothetical protein
MDATLLNQVAEKVLKVLNEMNAIGEARAQLQAAVASRAGISTRLLQHATLALMDRNVLVLSNCGHPQGIFVAETDDEIDRYEEQLVHRIRGLAIRRRGLRRIRRARVAARAIEPNGQRRMFG